MSSPRASTSDSGRPASARIGVRNEGVPRTSGPVSSRMSGSGSESKMRAPSAAYRVPTASRPRVARVLAATLSRRRPAVWPAS